jgi:uncharacterized coiled-coil DUF342 family protein
MDVAHKKEEAQESKSTPDGTGVVDNKRENLRQHTREVEAKIREIDARIRAFGAKTEDLKDEKFMWRLWLDVKNFL